MPSSICRICGKRLFNFMSQQNGIGPADFVLNILSVFIRQKLAEYLHQDFKWEFIVNMPKEGGTIPREAILNWIDKKTNKRNEVME
jgi:hypothetical protein